MDSSSESMEGRGFSPGQLPPDMVAIDDQLFDAAQLTETKAVLRKQGVTVDNDTVTWLVKFNAWEAGVIPVEFADEVPSANRDAFMRICNGGWGSAAPIACVPRTSQNGYLRVTWFKESSNAATCYSVIGQPRRLTRYELHLGQTCWNDQTVYHELGHAIGFVHEHQRPDRDNYVTIDFTNVAPALQGNFNLITSLRDSMPAYDFLSIMHYRSNTFATNPAQPTIVPKPGYSSFANTMGTAQSPSASDRASANDLYFNYFRSLPVVNVTPISAFDRNDFLDAMERLHAFYYSRLGLSRPQGLAIDGRPDFLGVATWIFDLYLGARSAGLNPEMSFGVVVTEITQTAEWRDKHQG
jgi:hypothetical protein